MTERFAFLPGGWAVRWSVRRSALCRCVAIVLLVIIASRPAIPLAAADLVSPLAPPESPVVMPSASTSAQTAASVTGEFSFTSPYFEPVGDSETMPQGVITALTYDAQGMLWIGTQDGLIRYDGYRYRKFVHDTQDAGSLPGDYVRTLHVAPDRKLWVGTNSNGLSVYDPATDRFTHFKHDPKQSGSVNASATIWTLAGNAAGDLWIGTDKGLDFLPYGGTEFRHYRHDASDAASLADDSVRSLLLDSHDVLWIGSKDGLQRLRPGAKSFERVVPVPEDNYLEKQTILDLLEAADGKVWIGTANNGAAWIDPRTRQLQRLAVDPTRSDRLTHVRIIALAQPEPSQIWLGSYGGGITVVSAEDGRVLQQLRHDVSIASSLALDTIGALAVDRAGVLAVGTWGGGLQRFNPGNSAFRLMRYSPNRAAGLSHADVRSVLELANGKLLVGTRGNGIDIVDRRLGRVGGYRPDPGRSGVLADGEIKGLAQTPDGTLWAGTNTAGMQRLPSGATTWQTLSLAQGLPSTNVISVFLDRKGELWVGTARGLAHWNSGRQRFETFRDADGTPMRDRVYAVIDDAQGRLWVSSNAGLWLLVPGAMALQVIRHEAQQPGSLSSDSVKGVLEDRGGRIWVDTEQGLDLLKNWDGKRAEFEHISAKLKRPGLHLGGNLLEDELGRIWTQWFVLDPVRMQLYALSKADGLDIGTAWIGSYGKTRDGLLLYGGTQGLAIVEPKKFHPWDYQPPLAATELKINGKTVPMGAIKPELSLDPKQRSFALEFSALDFSAPQKNRYRYRLQGYDSDWIATDAANRVAAYGNLAPGRYMLQVRGSNRLGEWSPYELAIPVRVLPAWYQTLWLRFIMGILVLTSIYGVVHWRTAVLRQRHRELEGVVAARTRELVEKNHELERLAVTDPLTGLYNRLKLDQILEEEFARCRRFTNDFAVLMMDVDKFKSVNDTYGHQVGDKTLIEIARILTEKTRETDVVGRWGGEEFLVIARGTAIDGALKLAEKLRHAVALHPFPVISSKTVSFGIATYRADDNISDLIARADHALYRAKESGRNRVEFDSL